MDEAEYGVDGEAEADRSAGCICRSGGRGEDNIGREVLSLVYDTIALCHQRVRSSRHQDRGW